MGVLHHVCGEHSWPSGRCKDDEQENIEGPNEYLNKDSKVRAALKIVLDPKWLKSSFLCQIQVGRLKLFIFVLDLQWPKVMFPFPLKCDYFCTILGIPVSWKVTIA